VATRTQVLTLVALMAALANVLSVPPIAVPIAPGITVHFTQLPIYLAALLAGPAAGLITGAVGALYMSSFVARIPFIIGGLAILGFVTGVLRKRYMPFIAGILAWLVQAPYVVVTDFVWFSFQMSPEGAWARVIQLMVVLSIEAVISSALAQIIVSYLSRVRITQQIFSK